MSQLVIHVKSYKNDKNVKQKQMLNIKNNLKNSDSLSQFNKGRVNSRNKT